MPSDQRIVLPAFLNWNRSDDYLAWIDGTLGIQENIDNYFTKEGFDCQIFDSPTALHD